MKQSEMRSQCIHTGNRLLQGELSAVQTYEMAIRRLPGLTAVFALDRISNQHRRSAGLLTAMVSEMGGEPASSPGAWGVFANNVQTAAGFFAARSTLEALKRGEEQGRKDYEDVLVSENARDGLKALIRNDLLTRVEDHISRLERLQNEFA